MRTHKGTTVAKALKSGYVPEKSGFNTKEQRDLLVQGVTKFVNYIDKKRREEYEREKLIDDRQLILMKGTEKLSQQVQEAQAQKIETKDAQLDSASSRRSLV